MAQQSLSVDLSDPTVQKMLGVDGGVAAGKRCEVVQLAGDAPDPTQMTGLRGMQSTHRLNAAKQEVVVVFGDVLMTVDVYALPGEPMKVHLYCPRCHKHSTVPGDRKRIEFEPRALNPMRTQILAAGRPELVALAHFGRISIEAFECPWEIGDAPHVAGAVHTGASMCRLKLVIDCNRAREA